MKLRKMLQRLLDCHPEQLDREVKIRVTLRNEHGSATTSKLVDINLISTELAEELHICTDQKWIDDAPELQS